MSSVSHFGVCVNTAGIYANVLAICTNAEYCDVCRYGRLATESVEVVARDWRRFDRHPRDPRLIDEHVDDVVLVLKPPGRTNERARLTDQVEALEQLGLHNHVDDPCLVPLSIPAYRMRSPCVVRANSSAPPRWSAATQPLRHSIASARGPAGTRPSRGTAMMRARRAGPWADGRRARGRRASLGRPTPPAWTGAREQSPQSQSRMRSAPHARSAGSQRGRARARRLRPWSASPRKGRCKRARACSTSDQASARHASAWSF